MQLGFSHETSLSPPFIWRDMIISSLYEISLAFRSPCRQYSKVSVPFKMHTRTSSFSLTLIIILISFFVPTTHSQDRLFSNCSNQYNCGQNIRGIGYPFWGQNRAPACGFQGLELKCQDNRTSTIEINNQTFRILNIVPNAHTMTIARNDLWDNVCPRDFVNTTLNDTLFVYNLGTVQFLNLYYSCSSSVNIPVRSTFTCNIDGRDRIGFYMDGLFSSTNSQPCDNNTMVPVLRMAMDEFRDNETMSLVELLNQGFGIEYRVDHPTCLACERSGGLCWSGTNTSRPTCLCSDGVSPSACRNQGSRAFPGRTVIGLLAGGASMVCLGIGFIIYFYSRKFSMSELLAFWKSGSKNDKHIEAMITQYGFSTPKRYKYAEIKRMTNSFKDELGRGGFGSVFKGKLADGSLVAVKVLKESKGSGEEFINEVASIGRTCHVNIVALLGFCYEGQKRALVYEFMCNGSLEKFIYHNIPTEGAQHLRLEKLYEIAVGISRGLEYLHRGCSTRILHFDIKPHNILLDEDFCPKISDFGLAKLHSRKESIISIREARGTIGYIAPEVYNRNFGGVSHKSDVYSYGMMVLEMVGGRKNIDVKVMESSKIYFPQWIYKQLELDEDVIQFQEGTMSMVENEIARKMIIVGLWCIQTNPSQRPSMDKVIEMLEGSMEALDIPPNPFFSSPPLSPMTSSTSFCLKDRDSESRGSSTSSVLNISAGTT